MMLTASLASVFILAAVQTVEPTRPVEPTDSVSLIFSGTEKNPIEIARKGARLAGAAYYCKADQEDVEVLISKIEGLIAANAPDTVQTVFAKLEFKNLLTATRARQPEQGCLAVEPALKTSLTALG